MIWDYISFAVIAFRKNIIYSLINIGGLAVGMAACLLISLYIEDELSFDKQFTDHEHIYRVEQRGVLKGFRTDIAPTLASLGSDSLESFGPPIKAKTGLVNMPRIVRYKETQDFQQIAFMEANFFDVLDFSSMIDEPKRAFINTTSIMLSERMVKKYFADENPIGKVLTLDNKVDYEVVGVFTALPKNMSIAFDFFVLLDKDRDMDPAQRLNWAVSNTFTYIKLEEGTDFTDISGRVDEYLQDGAHKQWPRNGSVAFEFELTPLADIHLYSHSPWGMTPKGDINTVITFGVIALLILSIASINYINLTTSRAMQRAREVGMRKALGATRRQLVLQFLLESVLVASVAVFLSIILLEIALPWFNTFLYKDMQIHVFTYYLHGTFVIGVMFIVGVFGGLYPAFVLSSFRPATVLNANQSTATGSTWFRNILVILQYTVSIALILTTILVYEQTNYARQFDLGFDKEHKLNINVQNQDAQPHIETLKQEFKKIPGVTGIALMRRPFPGAISFAWELSVPKYAPEGGKRVSSYEVDPHFFQVFGIKPLTGRVFSPEHQADYFVPPDQRNPQNAHQKFPIGNVVVNKSFLKLFGIPDPETAIGESVYIEPQVAIRNIEAVIVGVVEDTLFEPLHNNARAGYFSLRPDKELGAITLAIESEDLKATIQEVDRIWKKVIPNVPITRRFVDVLFDSLYIREERRGQLFSYFAGLAIVLSCLGLYGLSSFTVSRRKKEIGVRKAVGASVWDIASLLLLQFAKPVLIAGAVGIPIAAIFTHNWLQDFAYRIKLYDYIYLFPAVLLAVLIIAWITVLFHSVLAARTKPFISLRAE
jgi:putative ABC transport system permease protein